MAYSDKDWELVRAYFEAGCSLADIVARDEVKIKSRSQISKRANKDGWVKSDEKKQLINREVAVKSELSDIKKQKETLKETEEKVHNALVDERTKHIELFQKSALKNQSLTNLALNAISDNITTEKDPANRAIKAAMMLPALEQHGKITERNKNIVLGKDAETNVTVNTAVQASVQQIGEVKTQEEATRLYLDIMANK